MTLLLVLPQMVTACWSNPPPLEFPPTRISGTGGKNNGLPTTLTIVLGVRAAPCLGLEWLRLFQMALIADLLLTRTVIAPRITAWQLAGNTMNGKFLSLSLCMWVCMCENYPKCSDATSSMTQKKHHCSEGSILALAPNSMFKQWSLGQMLKHHPWNNVITLVMLEFV